LSEKKFDSVALTVSKIPDNGFSDILGTYRVTHWTIHEDFVWKMPIHATYVLFEGI